MITQTKVKGNPAHHRMGNARRKARRAECWVRGERRKEARRNAQNARAEANVLRRNNGEPTPWEISKAARSIARSA